MDRKNVCENVIPTRESLEAAPKKTWRKPDLTIMEMKDTRDGGSFNVDAGLLS